MTFFLASPLARAAAARRALVALVLALASAASGACASGSGGNFVWAQDYRAAGSDTDYVIAAGDLLSVRVWDNEKLSARTRVRADGRITVPLLNDVAVAGQRPAAVARDLERRLKDANLVLAPRVDVALDETSALGVSVLGKVTRAGAYSLPVGSGVAEAIAAAGGLTEFAHKDRIYVLRRAPEPVRVRFTFDALTGQSSRAALFRLRSGDVISVE